ncbi:MAG TPA: glutathione peroxidase [Cyclobacteriaceae bacterium]|nr:glutathione peroxidase [Cyclobacteriaceae bacterium]
MLSKIAIGGVIVVAVGLIAFLSEKLSPKKALKPVSGSIYDFRIKSLDGKEIDFSQYKGKNILIVNTASKCGYTYQYEDLQKLHEQYSDQVTVLGFPANNFLWQEPGTNADIAEFCQKNYGVDFQMFEKISVKGSDQHPLYQWLEAKSGKTPSWNFCKYIIDKQGNVIGFYPATVKPLDSAIVNKITR